MCCTSQLIRSVKETPPTWVSWPLLVKVNVFAFFLVMSSFSICRCMMCKMTHLTVNMHFWEDLCVIPASKKELKKCNECTYNLIFNLRDCFQIVADLIGRIPKIHPSCWAALSLSSHKQVWWHFDFPPNSPAVNTHVHTPPPTQGFIRGLMAAFFSLSTSEHKEVYWHLHTSQWRQKTWHIPSRAHTEIQPHTQNPQTFLSYHTLTHSHTYTLYGRSQGKTRSDRITQDWGRVAALHASYCQVKGECICDCLNWVLLYSVCYFIVISPYLCRLWVSCCISREYLDVLWHFMNI